MTDARIPLEELPEWAQELIVNTALGFLNFPNAYATKDLTESYSVHIDGFQYTVLKGAPFVI